MKKLIGPFILAVIIGVGMASYSYAADDKAAPSTQTVTGDLLKIEGEFYVVKEMSGKEIRLHVDKTTAAGRCHQSRRQGRGPGHGKEPRRVHQTRSAQDVGSGIRT